MNVDKTNSVNFGAGNVYLRRLQAENIPSYKAIKKIAEDKNMDIFISKAKDFKSCQQDDVYLVMVAKSRPIVERNFFKVGEDVTRAVDWMSVQKNTEQKELSVKIYNIAMNTIESLEKRLGIIK